MKTACTSRVRAKQIGGDAMLDLFLLPNEPSAQSDWQWLSVRGYASVIPWNIFPTCQCVGGLGRACPSKKTGILSLYYLQILSLWIKLLSKRIPEVSSDVFPTASVKSIFFFFQVQVSATIKGCITDKKKKKTPPALECDDPSFNLESVVESLPSFRKTALVDKLVESWSRHLPHWEPESGTIWRFTRSPVLCWGERTCAKFSFQSYSACREYHPLLHCWFWIRRNKQTKKT